MGLSFDRILLTIIKEKQNAIMLPMTAFVTSRKFEGNQ